jgi:hypothetical protein
VQGRTRPDRPWGPPSLLHNGYRVSPVGKAAGAWRWPPTLHLAPTLRKELSYTSTPPLGHRGLFLGDLYLYLLPLTLQCRELCSVSEHLDCPWLSPSSKGSLSLCHCYVANRCCTWRYWHNCSCSTHKEVQMSCLVLQNIITLCDQRRLVFKASLYFTANFPVTINR